MTALRIQTDVPEPWAAEARYAWAALCDAAGVPYRFVDGREHGATVYYGRGAAPPTAKLAIFAGDWSRVLAPNVLPELQLLLIRMADGAGPDARTARAILEEIHRPDVRSG